MKMKLIKICFLLLILVTCKKNSEFLQTPIIQSVVDKLKTKLEIEQFIQKIDTNYKNFELKALQDFNRSFDNDSVNRILADSLKIASYYTKADFDNNGYSDLLAIGDNHTCYSDSEESCSFSPIVVMNYPNRKNKIIPIDLE